MTLMIPLTPEEEARLRQAAAMEGLDASEYVRSLVLQRLSAASRDGAPLTDEVWERLFDQLAEGSEDLPVLAPDAFSRESFYEGRP